METSSIATSPHHARGGGQVSYMLVSEGQFGSEQMSVTWVECAAGSQQPVHAHADSEQVYVIVRGRGVMIVDEEEQEVGPGTAVFIPPGASHAIRNATAEQVVYVCATAPPFPAEVRGDKWVPVQVG